MSTRANPNPPELSPQEIERFWANVNKTPGQGPKGDCWEWIPSSHRKDYGRLLFRSRQPGQRTIIVTRIAYFLVTGKWPLLFMLHRCDNPPCVNPDHLFEGTQKANIQDALEKGRMLTGSDNPAARLTEAVVREMRTLYAGGQFSHQKLADLYGVAKSTVRRTVTRKTWIHIP